MKWKLIGDIKKDPLTTILVNRDVKEKEIPDFMNARKECCYHYSFLSQKNNFLLAKEIIEYAVRNKKEIWLIVDCDCDGFTSAATLYNYLFDLYGELFLTLIHLVFHEGKEHGIEIEKLPSHNDFILIVPDAGTNDVNQCEILYNRNVPVIILDHHPFSEISKEEEGIETKEKAIENKKIVEIYRQEQFIGYDYLDDKKSTYVLRNPFCILINSQLGYPNKQLSGVGVTYKFIQFLDNIYHKDFSDDYLDLVSLGMVADMMELNNPETKFLVTEGCQRIKNPFVKEHLESLKSRIKKVSSVSFGFYVSPYVNAMCRSGNQEEKEILFNCFLKDKAYSTVISNGRDNKGEKVNLYYEALRIAKNVKSRQDKKKKEKLEELLKKIEEEKLDSHSVLIILNEENDFANIAGLVCNELTHLFQRPALCLTKNGDFYEGSARGYKQTGILDFQSFCRESEMINWARGHANAFGVSIHKDNVEKFLTYSDQTLVLGEPVYLVDYVLKDEEKDFEIVKNIANIPEIWGNGLSEPSVAIEGADILFTRNRLFKKTKEDGSIYTTAKLTLKNGIDVMIFGVTPEQESLIPQNFSNPCVRMNFIGHCSKNVFKGKTTYQILVEDFEIVK